MLRRLAAQREVARQVWLPQREARRQPVRPPEVLQPRAVQQEAARQVRLLRREAQQLAARPPEGQREELQLRAVLREAARFTSAAGSTSQITRSPRSRRC